MISAYGEWKSYWWEWVDLQHEQLPHSHSFSLFSNFICGYQ
jgi:hypothetical protein